MYVKTIATASLAVALGLAPTEPVKADAGDAIAGALIGGIIGHAIANDQNRRATQQRQHYQQAPTRRASTASTAEREANKEVQTALNFFGYGVGSADGVLGSKSRSAITQMQALLGYPPTGRLTEYERTILTTAYHRGVAGGPMVQQALMSPQGVRGLLLTQRDEMAGIPAGQGGVVPSGVYSGGQMVPQYQAAAPQFAPQLAPPAAPVAAAALLPSLPALAPLSAAAPLPAPVAAPAPAPAAEPAAPQLPSFLGAGGTLVSLSSHCNSVGLKTNANGGRVTAATLTDAKFALDEQFCLARSFAISQGEDLTRQVQGYTPQQIATQCQALAPALHEQVAALSLEPRDEVLRKVSAFVLASGQSPAQLDGTARICLGSGYASDSLDVAIGSALLLTALGQKGYAELLGHHLAQGFGASQRPDLALEWYQTGLEAAQTGAAVFGQGQSDRTEVIRKAAYTVAGRVDLLPSDPAPALPVFAVPPSTAVIEAAAPTPKAPSVASPVAPTAPVVTAASTSPTSVAEAGAKAVGVAARLPFLLLGQ